MSFLKRHQARLVWIGLGVCLGLGLVSLFENRLAIEPWEATFGWQRNPSLKISESTGLGQPMSLRTRLPDRLEIRFATYTRIPKGKLTLTLLSGTNPPVDEADIRAREVVSQTIEADTLRDNRYRSFTFRIRPSQVNPQGDYYLVLKSPGGASAHPVSAWLDKPLGSLWPEAETLEFKGRGAISRSPAGGALSARIGYSGGSYRFLDNIRSKSRGGVIIVGLILLGLAGAGLLAGIYRVLISIRARLRDRARREPLRKQVPRPRRRGVKGGAKSGSRTAGPARGADLAVGFREQRSGIKEKAGVTSFLEWLILLWMLALAATHWVIDGLPSMRVLLGELELMTLIGVGNKLRVFITNNL